MASFIRYRLRIAAAATLFSTIGLTTAYGQQAAQTAPPPKTQWALLIGVREYANASPLRFSGEDVRKLDATLRNHLGYDRSQIVTICDDNAEMDAQPDRNSIEERVPTFLAKASEDDSLLIYFSGHAFRDIGNGQVYLAPRDFNSSDVNTMNKTGIAVDWLRKQLANCKARQQLLILDACHSGGAGGGAHAAEASSVDLRGGFGSSDKLIILASCGAEENSQEWESKRQSLFSYWLNQALHGRAAGHDDIIDFDDLKSFITTHVVRTSESIGDRQNPVAVKSESSNFTFRMKTRSMDTLVADIADELAENIEMQQLKHVGVPFFSFNNEGVGTTFGMEVAGKLESALLQRATIKDDGQSAALQKPQYTVVEPANLLKILKENNITRDDLSKLLVIKDFSSGTGESAAVVVGSMIKHANDRKVLVECKLVKAQGAHVVYVAKAAGYAEAEPLSETTLSPIDPFSDSTCPVHVQFMVKGSDGNFVERPVRQLNGRKFLPVHNGEIYQLWIDNRAGKTVLLRAMVDGCNTMPQRDIAPGDAKLPWEVKIPLKEARPWILGAGTGTVAIRGFVEQLNGTAKSNLREFQVADVQPSGERKDYTATPGRVDLAFYYDVQTRGKTLIPGQAIEDLIPLVPGPEAGTPIGIATVELVDAGDPELAVTAAK